MSLTNLLQRPALTIKIAEDYFNNNLSSQTADFDNKNGYYERTIPEAELDFEFGTDEDGKTYYLRRGE